MVGKDINRGRAIKVDEQDVVAVLDRDVTRQLVPIAHVLGSAKAVGATALDQVLDVASLQAPSGARQDQAAHSDQTSAAVRSLLAVVEAPQFEGLSRIEPVRRYRWPR